MAGALTEISAPRGNIKKTLGVVVSVFMLTVMFSPLLSLGIKSFYPYYGENDADIYAFGEKLEEWTLGLFGEKIKKEITDTLADAGMTDSAVNAVIRVSPSGEVSVEKIKLTVKEPDEAGRYGLEELLREKFGENVSIVYGER